MPMKEAEEMRVQSLGQEDPLEEGMVTHSSILAWNIPRTRSFVGLQSMGSQKGCSVGVHGVARIAEQLNNL